jgi:multidrug efflux pump subunit AcrA (membrane-fusion protein)
MTELTRTLPDPVLTRRTTAGRFLQFFYASIVIFFGVFLAWQLLKPFIYAQSSGSVSARLYVVSTPYTARVIGLSVKPGSTVKRGDILATVQSPEIDNLRVNLLRSVAEQVNKEADLKIRLLVATNSLAMAQLRLESARESVDLLRAYPGSVTAVFKAEVLREQALAALTLAQIEADIPETRSQIEAVRKARFDIEIIQSVVEQAFNDGMQVAPIDGVVSKHAANPGQSLNAGTPIIEIYDPKDLHIQWVLPADRRTQPASGAPVYILEGSRIMRGHIREVYTISERAQAGMTIFGRVRSGQLVRIELDNDTPYPAFMTDIEVRYNYWRFMDRIVDGYVHVMVWLGFWRTT